MLTLVMLLWININSTLNEAKTQYLVRSYHWEIKKEVLSYGPTCAHYYIVDNPRDIRKYLKHKRDKRYIFIEDEFYEALGVESVYQCQFTRRNEVDKIMSRKLHYCKDTKRYHKRIDVAVIEGLEYELKKILVEDYGSWSLATRTNGNMKYGICQKIRDDSIQVMCIDTIKSVRGMNEAELEEANLWRENE